MYPRVIIDTKKLLENINEVLRICHKNNVDTSMLVVKCLAGDVATVSKIAELDFAYLADSRLDNLVRFRSLPKKKALLRLPSPSEVDRVVKYSDMSLNSELDTIVKLDRAAKKQATKHEIMLMFDLGDLREGIFFKEDYLNIVAQILKLENIILKGIGTNLTCYGGVIPTPDNLRQLLVIKDTIENRFQIKLDYVSGGNSSSFHLLESGLLPEGINCLRYGEIFLMGRETAYGGHISSLHHDVFTLEAELIEVQSKPSYPIGETGMNSFGEKVDIIDQGIMLRGILAIGKQDVIIENLTPKDANISIIGGSSDHLLVDLTRSDKRLGDIVEFNVNYPGLLHLMNSKYVKKIRK
ncbi:MAG: alanine/ornithine racemase family PLP-dependent enzyme [Bacilli bacterium]|nr:alanine/ornithine racemase family PLP-dependent enzyme [Bacilli bacterium]